MMFNGQQQQKQAEERLRELQREQAQLQQQIALQKFAASFEVELAFPATIVNGSEDNDGSKNVRTSKDLIQHRLLEAGVLFDVPAVTAEIVEAAGHFISDLERTDCFDAVQVTLGTPQRTTTEDSDEEKAKNETPERTLQVKLHEKKWYRLHAGAGLKTSSADMMGMNTGSSDSFLPIAEMEISAGLRNLTGHLDKTELQYSLDTKSIASWSLSHSRPLYSVLPKNSQLELAILSMMTGSQYQLTTTAALDTVDHEWTRGYKEFQRLLSVKVANTHNVPNPTMALNLHNIDWFGQIEWQCLYRDLVPRRHATLPYQYDASSPVVASAGPSVKHSFTGIWHWNSPSLDHPILPMTGYQIQTQAELATPPGDVGFIKGQAAAAAHLPLSNTGVAFHANASTGYLHPLSFGGLCNGGQSSHISDRFFIGGSGSLRGFLPAGIGPRAMINENILGSSRTGPGGNSLGGDFFYTTTAMASASIPNNIPIVSDLLSGLGLKLFAFGSAGTCANIQSLVQSALSSNASVSGSKNKNSKLDNEQIAAIARDVVRSTRLSAGVGIATAAMGPKLEITYAWPIRFGPRDGRRQFQLGLSFSLG